MRLVAGALDSAVVDEYALVTAELVQLEPAHLRALFGFFHFGRKGNEASEDGLRPDEAGWATNRFRTLREVAGLLGLGREAAYQVLLRLDRLGYVDLDGGPDQEGESASRPTEWSGRVLTLLFPKLLVEFRDAVGEQPAPAKQTSTPPSRAAPSRAATAKESRDEAADRARMQDRAIVAIEEEIKKIEREQAGPGALTAGLFGGSDAWLRRLRSRLRKIDPTNPWAYDSFE